MIGTRILVGSLLAIATVGVLVVDGYLAPWFPCIFLCLMAAGVLASRELVTLFPEAMPPVARAHNNQHSPLPRRQLVPDHPPRTRFRTRIVLAVPDMRYVAAMVAAFLLEMYRYRQPGGVVARLGATVLSVAYLGLLPCFFVQIRFIDSLYTGLLLAVTIIVPKCNDVAAFFTGTFIGRTKMTPLLSPKKTWEGLAGGMIGGTLVAVIVSLWPRSFAMAGSRLSPSV